METVETRIKEIIENISNLGADELKAFFGAMAKFHKYSINNQFILASEGASQVASFKKWLELKRQVKKGAKAIYILAPKKYNKSVKDEKGEEELKSYIGGFRWVPVFDIADTEGEELKKGMTTASNIELECLLSVAAKMGFNVDFEPMEFAKGGYIRNKDIRLNSNLSKIENTGTLVHELAHGALGHQEEAADATSKDAKEQEAEMVTALLCQELGIERKSEFYLKSWGTGKILEAMPKISKAYSEIKKAIEG